MNYLVDLNDTFLYKYYYILNKKALRRSLKIEFQILTFFLCFTQMEVLYLRDWVIYCW